MRRTAEFLAGWEAAVEFLRKESSRIREEFRPGRVGGMNYINGVEHAVGLLEDRLDGFLCEEEGEAG